MKDNPLVIRTHKMLELIRKFPNSRIIECPRCSGEGEIVIDINGVLKIDMCTECIFTGITLEVPF